MPNREGGSPTPFLRSIAETFYRNTRQELYRYRFIFQNKRAGLFFQNYLKRVAQADGVGLILPEVTTLGTFLRQKLHLPEEDINNKLFIIFEIYQLYLELFLSDEEELEAKMEKVSFNDFFHIGELILNDFNDMDKHLIETELILKNASNLAELTVDPATYLTVEQREALKRFNRGISVNPEGGDQPIKAVFDRFWVNMPTLYNELKKRLKAKGLAYEGMLYREICEQLSEKSIDLSSHHTTNVFIGLNALTKSEKEILKHFQEDETHPPLFYWDYDSFLLQEGYLAGKFSESNKQSFPEPEKGHPFYREKATELTKRLPEVEVVSIPSNVAQAKFIGDRLKALEQESENLEVAVVLPEERLLMPFLSNLPAEIKHINITMGYPIKETPIVGMLLRLLQMHKLYYVRGERWRGEEIIEVLSFSPIQKSLSGTAKRAISEIIYNEKRYYLTHDEVMALTQDDALLYFITVLPPQRERSATWLLQYLTRLVKWLLSQLSPAEEEEDADEPSTYQGESTIYHTILDLLERQVRSIEEYNTESIYGSPFTVEMMTNLLKGLLSQARVPYKGEPLKGLQVMGLLETRGLDFKYIFVPDATEGTLPTKTKVLGILPKELRYAFGMPTYQWQDYTRAYNFFRLISRADKVTATYDSRKGDLSVGEPSRYILLLDYLYGAKVSYATANYLLRPLVPQEEVVDQDLVQNYLTRLTSEEHPQPAHLSASSLYDYTSCPRRFYYQKILGLKEVEELEEILQPKELGTLLHQSINVLYAPFTGQYIDPIKLSQLNDRTYVTKHVASIYTELFNEPAPRGVNQISFDNTVEMILKIIKEDLQLLESNKIFYMGGEKELSTYLNIPNVDTIAGIHFKGFVDRIDRVEPLTNSGNSSYIRVIDYKTGSNKPDVNFKELSSVALQLLLYCYALSRDKTYEGKKLKPIMCKPANLEEVMMPLIHEGTPLESFDVIQEDFLSFLRPEIEALVGESQFPTNNNSCGYCPAKSICSDYKAPYFA